MENSVNFLLYKGKLERHFTSIDPCYKLSKTVLRLHSAENFLSKFLLPLSSPTYLFGLVT